VLRILQYILLKNAIIDFAVYRTRVFAQLGWRTMAMDLNPDTLLTRLGAAQFLTEQGYQTAPATLATKASRGGGPEYECYGRRPLYRPEKLLEWAKSRLSKPVRSSSEAEARNDGRPKRERRTSRERVAAPPKGARLPAK
jgi:hypothetical protein